MASAFFFLFVCVASDVRLVPGCCGWVPSKFRRLFALGKVIILGFCFFFSHIVGKALWTASFSGSSLFALRLGLLRHSVATLIVGFALSVFFFLGTLVCLHSGHFSFSFRCRVFFFFGPFHVVTPAARTWSASYFTFRTPPEDVWGIDGKLCSSTKERATRVVFFAFRLNRAGGNSLPPLPSRRRGFFTGYWRFLTQSFHFPNVGTRVDFWGLQIPKFPRNRPLTPFPFLPAPSLRRIFPPRGKRWF